MKRFLVCVSVFVLAVSAIADRVPTGSFGRSYVEPYTKVITLTDTSGTWLAATDSVQVYEVRVKSAGKVRLIADGQTTAKNIWLTDYDILRIKVTSIILDSCTTDTIMVFGYNLR